MYVKKKEAVYPARTHRHIYIDICANILSSPIRFTKLTHPCIYFDIRPTFQFFKSGQKVAELKGASAGQIEQLVKKHQGETASGSDGDGNSGSSSSKSNYGITGHVSIYIYTISYFVFFRFYS